MNSENSVTVAMSRLRSSASKANLMIHNDPGDGNCLYWYILYQLEMLVLQVLVSFEK